MVAVASVFLAAKDRSFPFRISDAARLLFELEMKMTYSAPANALSTTGLMKGGVPKKSIVGGT